MINLEIWSKSFEPNPNYSPVKNSILKLRDNMQGKNFLRKKHCIPRYVKKKLKRAEIVIYSHALSRWNKRVGPSATAQELSTMMKQLIRLNRISFIGDDYGYIDNEILFIYEWTSNREISIITFYGRISTNICLQNFCALRKYNKHKVEQLNLDLGLEELDKQAFPIIPHKVIRFFINSKKYELSLYKIEDNNYGIFVEQGEGVNKVQFIYQEQIIELQKEYPGIEEYFYSDT